MDNISIPKERYEIHKSLVKEGIITHPRVRECSTKYLYLKKQERDGFAPNDVIGFGQNNQYYGIRKRCNRPKECPICSFIQDRRLFARVQTHVDLLKENDGDIHLLTFTLRHNRSHSHGELKELLHKSVQHVKTSYPFKKFYGVNDRLFSLHQYEDCWNPNTGFHPHAHLHIGTTSKRSKEEIESMMKPEWVKVVSKFTSDKSMIPSLENGLDVQVGRDDPFYNNQKTLENEIDDFFRDSSRRFHEYMEHRKSCESIPSDDLEMNLVGFHSSAAKHDLPVAPKLIQRLIFALKNIYQNCINRYRIHLRENKKHPLYSLLQNF